MAFTMLTKRKMFDALWERAGKAQKAPSLRAIVKSAQLTDEAEAERLLNEMQADGAISIVQGGAYPWLTLRRNTYSGPLIAGVWLDPEKMVRRPLVAEDADAPSPVIRMHEEIERRLPNEIEVALAPLGDRRFRENRMPARPEPEVAAVRERRRAQPPSNIDQGSTDAERPQMGAEEAPKREGRTPQAPSTALTTGLEARRRTFMASEGSRTRRMAIYLTPGDYAVIDGEAERLQVPTGRLASDAIADFADALRCATGGKHRLSAAVQRAWREDGRTLDAFVTALIEIGLDEYSRVRGERAAA